MGRVLGLLTFLLALATPAFAQDISGRWQGTVTTGRDVRMVLDIIRAKGGGYSGQQYLIDQNAHPTPLSEVTIRGGVVIMSMQGGLSYRGELSADGKRISGDLNMGISVPMAFERAPKTGAWPMPDVRHTTRMITVDDGVKLEVVDWGGSGPPLVFIAGLNSDAHVFDLFAPKFTAKHHVYGFTRRGYGASDRPDPAKASYAADRLANDVLQVIAQMKIEKPVLAGHSQGGEELSAVATLSPDKVAGLVYLDAAYVYAFYTPGITAPVGDSLSIALNDLEARLRRLKSPSLAPAQAVALLDDINATSLKDLETDLAATRSHYQALSPPGSQTPQAAQAPPPAPPAGPLSLESRINLAVLEGEAKFTGVKAPVLSIFALSPPPPPTLPEDTLKQIRLLIAAQEEQAKRFEAAHPGARVVRIPSASHSVFVSHPGEVFREMDAFLDRLQR
jgi:non-heme chloroperoxidase